jgi:hypothetical protein
VNLSFCSGYLRVNLFIIRCFEPDSIALINPLAELAAPVTPPAPVEVLLVRVVEILLLLLLAAGVE